jgi:histidine triad (HIT) family protein
MASIFTKIMAGDIPSYKVAENEFAYAFLDIRPLAKGHTLVVPKLEVDKLFDLPVDHYRALWDFAYQVAHAMELVLHCNRIGVTVIGLEVPHAHIHLIPIRGEADMNFAMPKLQLEAAEMQSIAQKIGEALLTPA